MTKRIFRKHVCADCGCVLQSKTVQSGKCTGQQYFTKLCDTCLIKKRKLMGQINGVISHEKCRKYFTAVCVICGNDFKIGGRKGRSGHAKVCSQKCRNIRTAETNKESGAFYNLHTENADDKRSLALVNVPRKTKGQRADEDNLFAKQYHIISPSGAEYEGKNVSLFVRENSELFDPIDTVPNVYHVSGRRSISRRSNAQVGLLSIVSGRRNSWKGWVAER